MTIRTRQLEPHPRLALAVRKHLSTLNLAPIPDHTREAFEQTCGLRGDDRSPLCLDSGCGTGESTFALSRRMPGHLVIGIDRSAHRLAARLGDRPAIREGNTILVRAELASFWRLAVAAGWRLSRHYLLYPNPEPKAVHYLRRWHAHPAFADLLALGGGIEMRTNWRVYAEEFRDALAIAGYTANLQTVQPDIAHPCSPFERKYAARGEGLWSVRSRLWMDTAAPRP